MVRNSTLFLKMGLTMHVIRFQVRYKEANLLCVFSVWASGEWLKVCLLRWFFLLLFTGCFIQIKKLCFWREEGYMQESLWKMQNTVGACLELIPVLLRQVVACILLAYSGFWIRGNYLWVESLNVGRVIVWYCYWIALVQKWSTQNYSEDASKLS